MDLRQINPTKQALSLFDEFKAFAFKGNVIDLAVGVIIGGAFGNIVKSLVDNIIMPVIGVVLPGDKGYEGWIATINGKVIPYGRFLGDIVNFLIVAAALFFFIVKFLGWVMSLRTQEIASAPALTKDQALLTEIRDLLKQRSEGNNGPNPFPAPSRSG
jgi:large conductance mechanosensitive channel